MSDLYASVLVLNRGYTPINIKPVADAICDVISDVAHVIEHEKFLLNGDPNPYYYNKYTWAEWASLPIHTKKNAAGEDEHYVNLAAKDAPPAIVKAKRVVHGVKGSVVRAPFVMIHKIYSELPDLDIRKTRKNIWLRDGCKCQYCGTPVALTAMTYDHVKPKAEKGGDSWGNLVTACFKCNIRKGMRTPEQAKMPLIGWMVSDPEGKPMMTYKPFKPKWYPLFTRFTAQSPTEWDEFLPEAAKNRPPAIAPVRKHA